MIQEKLLMKESHYQRTLNFGHRGASGLAPENTLAAFELAADLGADGIECDVQLSRDGQVVICHDSDVDRTTNAHGRVHDFTAKQLGQMDAGSWFKPAFVAQHIPTLQELIGRLGDRLLFNIELKPASSRSEGLEEAFAAIVRENNLYDRLITSSFNPSALRRLHRIDPRIDLGVC